MVPTAGARIGAEILAGIRADLVNWS